MSKILETSTTAKGVVYAIATKVIEDFQNSEIAKGESNDCVVRAVAVAFDTNYDEAHRWVKRAFGRKDKKGTRGFHQAMAKRKGGLGKTIEEIGDDWKGGLKRPSTYYNNSTKKLAERTYPGEIIDTFDSPKGEMNKVRRAMTLGTFLETHTEGTFIVQVSKHAFAIKDGVVVGNPEDGFKVKTRIQAAFKIS